MRFAQWIDGRIRDLREPLLAVIPEWPRQAREKRGRGIVAHAPDRLLAFENERLKQQLVLIVGPAEGGHGTFSAPRHKHNFDQIRYVVSGSPDFGHYQVASQGQSAFFPAGAAYGPETIEESEMLLIQWGQHWMTRAQHDETYSRMLQAGEFKDGYYVTVDAAGNEQRADARNAVWETFNARKLVYPTPRYPQPVIMEPEGFEWRPAGPGVSGKVLGRFTEDDVYVGNYRWDEAGAVLTLGAERTALLVRHHRVLVDAWSGRALPGGDRLYPPNPGLADRIWQATFNIEGARRAGAAGDGLMLSRTQPRPAGKPRLSLPDIQNPMIDAYLASLTPERAPRILASRTVFVADDRAEALRLAEIGLARQRVRYAAIGRPVFVDGMSVHDQIAAMDIHIGDPDDVIGSLRADTVLARATDLSVQSHSIDPPHPFILRSIELVAEVVAPALGWMRTGAAAARHG